MQKESNLTLRLTQSQQEIKEKYEALPSDVTWGWLSEIAEKINVAKSTCHNYLNGKTWRGKNCLAFWEMLDAKITAINQDLPSPINNN